MSEDATVTIRRPNGVEIVSGVSKALPASLTVMITAKGRFEVDAIIDEMFVRYPDVSFITPVEMPGSVWGTIGYVGPYQETRYVS